MKKPIKSSHLALRFYVGDGWTQDELEDCLRQGSVSIKHPDDAYPYFTLDRGSQFDCEKLLARASVVKRWSSLENSKSDLEYLEDMNW